MGLGRQQMFHLARFRWNHRTHSLAISLELMDLWPIRTISDFLLAGIGQASYEIAHMEDLFQLSQSPVGLFVVDLDKMPVGQSMTGSRASDQEQLVLGAMGLLDKLLAQLRWRQRSRNVNLGAGLDLENRLRIQRSRLSLIVRLLCRNHAMVVPRAVIIFFFAILSVRVDFKLPTLGLVESNSCLPPLVL